MRQNKSTLQQIADELNRMRSYGNARREKCRQSTDVCPENKLTESEQTFPCAMKEDEIQDTETADALSADDASDANVCNAEQEDAPYDIISESVSESVSESKSDITSSSSTMHAHVRRFFRRRSFLPNGLAMVSFGRYAGGW
ncbi:MAG: hypothetical protein K2H71_04550 [Muribaculaceae bacterium]|nr:hypothetical protein [Muribaculaceae bacterium]